MMSLIPRTPTRRPQRGAALLMAMVIVTLVATMAASMVWQQWRAVQVETAERVRTQASWILVAAVDFARLVLREDGRASKQTTDLTDNWAKPIAESRLSSLLAADSNNNSADSADVPEAFLSGKMEDAHAKFNLRNLVDANGLPDPKEVEAFRRLLTALSLRPSLADTVADIMARGTLAELSLASPDPALLQRLGGETGRAQAPLVPPFFDQVLWMIDGGTLEKLRPYVTLLPTQGTKINVNTAPAQVIVAAIEGIDLARATRIVQERQRKPFKDKSEISNLLGAAPAKGGATPGWNLDGIDVRSEYFEIIARLRYEDNVVEQRNLVQRDSNNNVIVLQRSRFSGLDKGANTSASP